MRFRELQQSKELNRFTLNYPPGNGFDPEPEAAHLNPCMAAQVEVKLGRVCDGAVDRGARWDVSTLPNLQEDPESGRWFCWTTEQAGVPPGRTSYPLSFVRAEETSVVTLLNHNVGDARPVVLLQTDAGLPDGYELWPSHLRGNTPPGQLAQTPPDDPLLHSSFTVLRKTDHCTQNLPFGPALGRFMCS